MVESAPKSPTSIASVAPGGVEAMKDLSATSAPEAPGAKAPSPTGAASVRDNPGPPKLRVLVLAVSCALGLKLDALRVRPKERKALKGSGTPTLGAREDGALEAPELKRNTPGESLRGRVALGPMAGGDRSDGRKR